MSSVTVRLSADQTAEDRRIQTAAIALMAYRGFGYTEDPREGGQDLYDLSTEAHGMARAMLDAVQMREHLLAKVDPATTVVVPPIDGEPTGLFALLCRTYLFAQNLDLEGRNTALGSDCPSRRATIVEVLDMLVGQADFKDVPRAMHDSPGVKLRGTRPACPPDFASAAQDWLRTIPMMQQSVLFSAIRGPDGFRKHHPVKPLLRFYRRCVLLSAIDGAVLPDPYTPGGGSFTGPSIVGMRNMADDDTEPTFLVLNGQQRPLSDWPLAMKEHVDGFIHARDEMALHYFAHAMHAFQIVGAHHPDAKIRQFWTSVYMRMVNALHLLPEPIAELDRRLSDDEREWALKADEAGSCSD